MPHREDPTHRPTVSADELNMQADFEDSVIAEEIFADSIPAEILEELEESAKTHKKEEVLLDFNFDGIIIRD